MKDFNAEMDRIGRQMVACENKCAGVSCDRPNGILPRCLILETAGRSNEGGCAIVGINPSHASRDEIAYCMKEGVTYDVVVKYWQEKIKLQPYYEKLRKFADAFGLNGPILWTALTKCENADGIKFPPLRALRACTVRFLTQELEAIPASWPLIGVGKEACLALAYHYPTRTVIGVPNPKGSSSYHFSRHLPGGRLHERSTVAVRHVLANPPGELLWIGDVEHHNLLLMEETRPQPSAQRAPVKAVGMGCAGDNAVSRMCDAGLRGVESIVADSDAQALCRSKAEVRIQLGEASAKGLGTEGDSAKGQATDRTPAPGMQPDDRQAALDLKDLEKPAFMRRRVRRLKLPDDQPAAEPLDLDFGVSP